MTVEPLPAPELMAHLKWGPEPRFYRPDYNRALSTVMPTVFELLGHPPEDRPTLGQFLPVATPRRVKRVFMLCVDSLGFKEIATGERFPKLYKDFGTWVTSVFPSITSTALSSLYQGLPPSRHGIAGHLIWKDFPGGIVDMLRMRVVGAKADLEASGFNVNQWKREPGLLEPPLSDPVRGLHLMPMQIVKSGLSTYSYGNSTMVGFVQPVEGFTKAVQMLEELDTGWVGLYLDMVDTLGHVISHDATQFGLTVRYIEQCVHWLAGALPPQVARETLLVVIADHGQDTIQEMLSLRGEHGEWLRAHTRALGFSGRTMHIYLRPEHDRAVVRQGLNALMGDRGRVFEFGEVAPLAGARPDDAWARQSLGDLVAILHEGFCWDAHQMFKPEGPYPTRLVSQHGGMSWNEMFVPLLAAPMDVVART